MKVYMKLFSILLILALLVSMTACQEAVSDSEKGETTVKVEKVKALPKFEALNWDSTAETPAGDFTYEVIEAYDPLTQNLGQMIRLLTYTGKDPVVKVPEKIDGYLVRYTVDDIFRNNTSITHICLPQYLLIDTMESDGEKFFENCTALQQVMLPPDQDIGSFFFTNCTALRHVSFHNTLGTDSFTKYEIGSFCFSGCTSLTDIFLPDNIDCIGSHAFLNCAALESIDLKQVEIIGSNAFDKCTSLTSVSAPCAYTVSLEAFLNCSNLTDLTLCQWSHEFSSLAFSGCSSLKTIRFVPFDETNSTTFRPSDNDILFEEDGVIYQTYGNRNGQAGCYVMHVLEGKGGKDVTLRNDATDIGEYAFNNCSVKNIEIPGSLRHIDSYAFTNCPKLEKVTFAKGADELYLQDDIFDNCPALKTIDLSARNAAGYKEITQEYLCRYDCPSVDQVITAK